MYLAERIKAIIEDQGLSYRERSRSIYTTCPECGQNDKLSILKQNGATICYRGSCQFKGWFEDWLALTAHISRKEARDILYQKQEVNVNTQNDLTISLYQEDAVQTIDPTVAKIDMLPVSWPTTGSIGLEDPLAADAIKYVVSRGIDLGVATKYGIRFDPNSRRILFPISIHGVYYGWQGRAIDPVEPGFKVRNNEGFRRDSCLMFSDRLKDSKHVIIAEGPFDAIKFDRLGGNVATMGKAVTASQIDIINQYPISIAYLALDDDAALEMRDLAKRLKVPTFRLEVPQTCIDRCAAQGKKADFGECTFEECQYAFSNARKLHESYVMIHLRDVGDVIKDRTKNETKARK